ncbi:MAG TPA: hypothetical protein VGM03_05225 [Phycisphaerae bacterium]|jgi:hypothetical protein
MASSVGFPSHSPLAPTNPRVVEVWPTADAGGKGRHIFMTPLLDDSEPLAGWLTHALVHICRDEKHGWRFGRLALAVGLVGHRTSAQCGAALKARVHAHLDRLGAFPGMNLDKTAYAHDVQPARRHKIVCPACGWNALAADSWIRRGLPTCVCGARFQTETPDSHAMQPSTVAIQNGSTARRRRGCACVMFVRKADRT